MIYNSSRMSSLDRLIDLAKQTGDRLIVHDPLEGKDVVILDVDTYEHLVLGKRSVQYLSERELLDQINRDIAVWRANQEYEDLRFRSAALEKELVDNPPFDPFEEDFAHRSDWHSAKSVIGDRFGDEFDTEEDDDAEIEEEEEGDAVQYWEPVPEVQPQIHPYASSVVDKEPDDYRVTDPDVTSFYGAQTSPVPERAVEAAPDTQWKEETLPPEDPIFYEEPL